MYAPPQCQETRTDVLVDAIAKIRLGSFVTMVDGAYHATHAPVALRETAEGLTLESHFARPNPHGQLMGEGAATLVIFQGPHAYVSPRHYPSKAATGKVVPTWNYIAVHAHGPMTLIRDGAWLMRHLNTLTDANEAGREAPWQVGDAPDDFIAKLTRAIVGVSVRVEHLVGSWKLAQHKPDADRKGAMAGLAGEPSASANAVAEVMAELEALRR